MSRRLTRALCSRRMRAGFSAGLVALIALVVAAPALAADWTVSVSGQLPSGWKVNPNNIYSMAGYPGWEWVSRETIESETDQISAAGSVRAVLYPEVGVVTSPEAFVENVRLVDMQLYDATVIDSGEITFKGFPAYYAKGTVATQEARDGFPKPDGISHQEHFFVMLPDGKAIRIDATAGAAVELQDRIPSYQAEVDKVLDMLEITQGAAPGAPAGTAPPAWKTVAGGLAAVAAAASAIAGAAASRLGKRAKVDPNAPVGYVLQLSAERLAIGSAAQSPLTATVWRVLASGSIEPAEGAQVALHAPAGVGVAPVSGASPLSAGVWQTGDVVAGASLGVAASAPGGGTTATIPLDAEETSKLALAFEPAVDAIRPNGSHVVSAVATLEVSPALAASPDFDAATAAASIAFTVSPADWVDTGQLREVPGGRSISVAVSQPNPDSPAEPPATISVTATVQLPGRALSETVTLVVERPPVIDARPDRVSFAIGSKASEELLVWIEPADQQQWAFSAEWSRGDRAVATHAVRSDSPGTAVVRVTEAAGSLPPASSAVETSTLEVAATHPDWGTLKRHIKVSVASEGLYVDSVGQSRDGTFHVLADGSGETTDIDVRVFVRDTSGQIVFSPEASAAAIFEPTSAETLPGGAAWRYAGVEHTDGGIRPSNSPSAIHRFSVPRPLPTAGEPLYCELRVGSDAGPAELFSKTVGISLIGVNTAPDSKAWQTEKTNCLTIIDEFVPPEHRARLTALVETRGRTMGAEGLYQMRRQLWDFAYNETMREAHDHLTAAWWSEQVESTLDWVSWCGDIALGAATGSLAGTAASVGVGLLKPSLVSAMNVWVDGGSVSDWAYGQVSVFAGAVEGAATDVDAINKLAGNKALAWAVFIAYTFVRELMSDPNLSVTEAMKRIAQQMRDEGLVQFLRMAVAKGGAKTPAAKPDAKKPADKPAKPADKSADGDAKKPAEKEPPRGDRPAPTDSRAVKALAERVKYRNGKAYADPRDVLAIMRDPEATRSLKNADPAIRDAFENTRQEIYAEHDRKLKEYVQSQPGMEGKKIVVAEVRTPGKEAGFNTDRDFRVLVETTDPVTGKTVYVEVSTKKWVGESNKIFAGETGGPTDPKGAKDWAEKHQQLGTDKLHAEAAPDMSDQTFTKGPDGEMVATQGEPRIAAVKDGRGTLIDPETLGDVYEHKVAEQLNAGHKGEAFAQASKAVRDLGEIRDGYQKQDYDVGKLSEKFQTGMEIVKQAGTNGFDDPGAVAAADQALKDAGFSGGLKGFMSALSSQVESLKYAKK